MTATPTNDGTFRVTILASGNLHAADSEMTTYITVGGVEWSVHAQWRQTKAGWVFDHALP